jgi:hypothetical protein
MPSAHRFLPPWTIEEHNNACFIVKDATGQALGYFYFEDEPGRRSHQHPEARGNYLRGLQSLCDTSIYRYDRA